MPAHIDINTDIWLGIEPFALIKLIVSKDWGWQVGVIIALQTRQNICCSYFRFTIIVCEVAPNKAFVTKTVLRRALPVISIHCLKYPITFKWT